MRNLKNYIKKEHPKISERPDWLTAVVNRADEDGVLDRDTVENLACLLDADAEDLLARQKAGKKTAELERVRSYLLMEVLFDARVSGTQGWWVDVEQALEIRDMNISATLRRMSAVRLLATSYFTRVS